MEAACADLPRYLCFRPLIDEIVGGDVAVCNTVCSAHDNWSRGHRNHKNGCRHCLSGSPRVNRGIQRGTFARKDSYSAANVRSSVGSSYTTTNAWQASQNSAPYKMSPHAPNKTAWPRMTATSATYIG